MTRVMKNFYAYIIGQKRPKIKPLAGLYGCLFNPLIHNRGGGNITGHIYSGAAHIQNAVNADD